MMGKHNITMPASLLAFLFVFTYPSAVVCRNLASASTIDGNLRTYIVHVRRTDNAVVAGSDDLESWYRSFLPETTAGSSEPRLVYSYSEVFSGFAARLTEEEVKEMANKEGFVRAYPNKLLPLLTTHTPAFLGLQLSGGFWNASNLGKGVIIGVLDTGVLPDHPSFNDDGVPPPPSKWKGECEFDTGCNNKLIGARSFGQGFGANKATTKAPIDDEGHGTHTASTMAGNFVKNVNAFGLGNGTTSGMAPHAHLAIYKVCYPNSGCSSADILAGLDSAVKDGVDVLSLSLGGASLPYDQDPIAIGAFGATEKGIIVVCAAGNSGPTESTLSNEAPWILTVAASTVDRSFRSTVNLGNGKQFNGETLFQPSNFSTKSFPLIYPGKIKPAAVNCDTLDDIDIKGKIVVCKVDGGTSIIDKGLTVKDSGGVGVIVINSEEEGYTILAGDHVLPASQVSNADGSEILSYESSSRSPTASIIFNGTVLGTSPAPVVAFFSSRGPSLQSPGILKPDISGPGVNILAAWINTKDDSESNGENFNIISGTSMATPHISGIAALVKSLHPDWSPAAIKSAIITSSNAEDRDGNPIKDEKHQNASFFSFGAGHVNPSNAAEPGLVYDLDVDDYIAYLCGSGLGDSGVGSIVRRPNASCSDVKNITEAELNYPSITVHVSSGTVKVNRTVTNVGDASAKYTVEVDVPKGVTVTVMPETLQFSKVNEKKSFTVSVSLSGPGKSGAEGNLKWVSGKRVVRSPLVITTGSLSGP